MTATEWTRKEHADYVRWCEEHPGGFAWVCSHQTLHKADCRFATRYLKNKKNTERDESLNQSESIKYITADSLAVLQAREPRAAEESHRCSACGG